MRGHEDVLAMMDCVVTGCMVNRGKPDPEIFVAREREIGRGGERVRGAGGHAGGMRGGAARGV